MAGVRLESVSKKFGKNVVVHEMTMDIPDREFLVFVGPSGCGKTTTLRMIAGLETVSDGKIFIGDRIVNDVEPRDRNIAMVFQNYALYPHMSVYENMAFALKLRKMSTAEVEGRVKGAAEILGITHLLQRRPKEMSGGQRQRAALGRAMVRDPAVFLMDEPLSNLDAKLRVQMRVELVQLHRRVQTTTVYVTHDQVEAMTMGDRIVVMNDGAIQQIAAPKELYDHPVNRFVAGFIGSPPMNFINADLTREGERIFAQGTDSRRSCPPRKRRSSARTVRRSSWAFGRKTSVSSHHPKMIRLPAVASTSSNNSVPNSWPSPSSAIRICSCARIPTYHLQPA